MNKKGVSAMITLILTAILILIIVAVTNGFTGNFFNNSDDLERLTDNDLAREFTGTRIAMAVQFGDYEEFCPCDDINQRVFNFQEYTYSDLNMDEKYNGYLFGCSDRQCNVQNAVFTKVPEKDFNQRLTKDDLDLLETLFYENKDDLASVKLSEQKFSNQVSFEKSANLALLCTEPENCDYNQFVKDALENVDGKPKEGCLTKKNMCENEWKKFVNEHED